MNPEETTFNTGQVTCWLWKKGLPALLAALVGLAVLPGCKKVLLDGTIKSTRSGSRQINTLHDYDIAKQLAYAGLGRLEGMHRLAPENTNALAMLTRSWGGTAFAFIQDDYEEALDRGDDEEARYHELRTRAAFERAVHYGRELLGYMGSDFDEAKSDAASLEEWLEDEIPEEEAAEDLLWIGYAWIGRVAASVDIPEVVAELYVGVMLVEHSVKLDPTVANSTGHVILGAYHARNGLAELDESKKHFDAALALTEGKFLTAHLNLATRYHCVKRDRESYFKTLKFVVEAPDLLPEARLQNVIAKRRARRYLGNDIWQEECGFDA